MDKLEAFRSDKETIESWLDAFEARLLCYNIHTCIKKRHWCRALIGETGRNIIARLPQGATWEEIRQELCDILSETEDSALDDLLNYEPGDKRLGEIAADIMTKADRVTSNIDAQNRLGLRAFLLAIPDSIGKELRKQHFGTVKEALEEARFLQRVQRKENLSKEEVLAVNKHPSPEDLVEECLRRLKTKGLMGERRERRRKGKGKAACWCCGEEGHLRRECPDRAAQNGAGTDENHERSQVGMFMAPVSGGVSRLISVKVKVAGVEVTALLDTGATTSCCRWGWFKDWSPHLGPLIKTNKTVIGVGNCPIKVKGITRPVEIEWDTAKDMCELVILTTLKDVDVILGMDILSKLGIQIDVREGKARPRQTSQEWVSHINYVKQFYGKNPKVKTDGRGNVSDSCHSVSVKKGRVRLIYGRTRQEKRRNRCIVSSTQQIVRKGRFLSGPVQVALLDSGEDLPEGLKTVVHATDVDGTIDGQRLLDLCGKRSEEEGGSVRARFSHISSKTECRTKREKTRIPIFRIDETTYSHGGARDSRVEPGDNVNKNITKNITSISRKDRPVGECLNSKDTIFHSNNPVKDLTTPYSKVETRFKKNRSRPMLTPAERSVSIATETFKLQTKYLVKSCTNMIEIQPKDVKINQTQELVRISTSNNLEKENKSKEKAIVSYRGKTRRRLELVSQTSSLTAKRNVNKISIGRQIVGIRKISRKKKEIEPARRKYNLEHVLLSQITWMFGMGLFTLALSHSFLPVSRARAVTSQRESCDVTDFGFREPQNLMTWACPQSINRGPICLVSQN